MLPWSCKPEMLVFGFWFLVLSVMKELFTNSSVVFWFRTILHTLHSLVCFACNVLISLQFNHFNLFLGYLGRKK